MCLARYVAQVSSPHERHGTRGETPRKLAGEDACATRQTHGPAARGQLPRLRTGSGVQGAKFHLGDISLSTLRACVVCLPHAKKRLGGDGPRPSPSPLRGCSSLAALAAAKIPRRSAARGFQAGSNLYTVDRGRLDLVTDDKKSFQTEDGHGCTPIDPVKPLLCASGKPGNLHQGIATKERRERKEGRLFNHRLRRWCLTGIR